MNTFQEFPVNKQAIANRKLISCIGINDADYLVQIKIEGKSLCCPYYRTWVGMFTRCYTSAQQRIKYPTYIDCSVTPEWHRFTIFKAWMETQNWVGLELDKDILEPGNKVYGPSTCCFVTHTINSLLNRVGASRGKYPQGVNWHKRCKRFVAKCNVFGKSVHIGCFTSPEEASAAYTKFKANHIREVADTQPEPIRSALYRQALLIYKEI